MNYEYNFKNVYNYIVLTIKILLARAHVEHLSIATHFHDKSYRLKPDSVLVIKDSVPKTFVFKTLVSKILNSFLLFLILIFIFV